MTRARNGGLVEHHGEIVGVIRDEAGEPLEPILDAQTYEALMARVSSRRRGAPPSGHTC